MAIVSQAACRGSSPRQTHKLHWGGRGALVLPVICDPRITSATVNVPYPDLHPQLASNSDCHSVWFWSQWPWPLPLCTLHMRKHMHALMAAFCGEFTHCVKRLVERAGLTSPTGHGACNYTSSVITCVFAFPPRSTGELSLSPMCLYLLRTFSSRPFSLLLLTSRAPSSPGLTPRTAHLVHIGDGHRHLLMITVTCASREAINTLAIPVASRGTAALV